MKMPNNWGSISKLSGNRRNPWMVLIHCGTDEYGYRIRKPLGYYKGRREALKALEEYHAKPFDLTKKKPTFEEVFKLWFEPHCEGKSVSLRQVYHAAFNSFKPIHESIFEDLKPFHYEQIFGTFTSSKSKKYHMDLLLKLMYQYAVKSEIVDKDQSKFLNIGKTNETESMTPYNDLEVKRISRMNGLVPECLMIMFYTGFRIGELLNLEISNINLNEMTIVGGLKTEAGKNRLVPIHPYIEKIIMKYYNDKNQYLITKNGHPVSYDIFLREFNKFKEENNFDHSIHEARHTFITNLDRVNAKDNLVKKLVGHAQTDFTKRVYTHNTIEQLRNTILLLSGF